MDTQDCGGPFWQTLLLSGHLFQNLLRLVLRRQKQVFFNENFLPLIWRQAKRMEDERIARVPIVGGLKKCGDGMGAKGGIRCGEDAHLFAAVRNVPQVGVTARNKRKLVFVGVEKKNAEAKILVHRIFRERLVEGVEHLDRVLLFFAVLKVELDGHPHHAAEDGAVEERGDARLEGLGERDAVAVLREAEEIEIETGKRYPSVDGDADFDLRPTGPLFRYEDRTGLLDHVEHFVRSLLFPLLVFGGERLDVLRDVGDEIDDVLVALGWVGLERLLNDGAERFGEEREMDDAVAESAEDELVGNDAERIDVGRVADLRRILFLFGTHVDGGPHHPLFLRDPLLFAVELRNAEIDHFDFTRFCDQDVFWLQVSVDHAMGVEMAKGVGDLEDDLEGPFMGERLLLDELAQRNALNELHRDVEPFLPLPLAVKADDVGVVGDADDLRLFQKAVGDLFILEIFGEEHFDDEGLRRVGMSAQIEDAHPPLIQQTFDFVGADFLGQRKTALRRVQIGKGSLFVKIIQVQGFAVPKFHLSRPTRPGPLFAH